MTYVDIHSVSHAQDGASLKTKTSGKFEYTVVDTKPELRLTKIVQEGLADLPKRIGLRTASCLEPWNYDAARDAVRNNAHGIGDDNPLSCYPEYRKSVERRCQISLADLGKLVRTASRAAGLLRYGC